MSLMQLLSAALLSASAGGSGFFHRIRSSNFGPTPSRSKGRNKSGLPSAYPGAKLARQAAQGRVGVRHV